MTHPLDHLPNLILEDGIYKVRRMLKGRRKKISTGFGIGQEKKAERRYFEIQKDLNDDKAGWKKTRVPTFDDWWDLYRQVYTARKRPGSQANDHKAVRWVLPDLTRRTLDEVTPGLADRILNRLRKTLSESTVRTYRAILKAMFAKAVTEGHIPTNPWDKAEVGKMPARQRVLSLREEAQLKNLASPFYRRWLTFALGTGCRIEESRNVTTRDLDFEAKSITLRVTKYDKPRVVPMFPAVEQALREQLEDTPGQLWGQRSFSGYSHFLHRRARTLKVEAIGTHTFRHTFATRWLQEGKDIFLLSKILGHASVMQTEKTYAHLLQEDVVKLALSAGAPKQAARIVAFHSGTGSGPGR